MPDSVRITLLPLGHEITVERGTPLQDVLFPFGVEFPCGGNAVCESCKVKVLSGALLMTQEQENILSRKEAEQGWRLACCCKAESNITLEIAQWEARILADDRRFEFKPREGFGIAVDLGTTTVAVQLLDLRSGNVLAVEAGLNAQGRHGADVMSRVTFALMEQGQPELESLIRTQVGAMITSLLASARINGSEVVDVTIVGNTVMHHLFSGLDVAPLSMYPFESPHIGVQRFPARQLGWTWISKATVSFLPAMGSFVGSDILAGILSTNIHKSESLVGLIDLGTNGEIVIGNKDKLLYCSTAAGPAFEGACISMGMRATTGAIAQVVAEDSILRCRVLGNVPARGICGSGLVDAIAAGLSTRGILEDGRITAVSGIFEVSQPVVLTQSDVRELQVAKAAIAAGVKILTENLGASPDDLTRIYLAGAFGNYINRANASRIGLLPVPAERITPTGNSALLGAKLALFDRTLESLTAILSVSTHVALNLDEHFQDVFVEEMMFPEYVGR